MRPSIKMISEITGYSQATISNVLNNKKGTSKSTAKKILEVAMETGYLKAQKISSVKLVVYKKSGQVLTETPLINSLIEGVEAECRENGLDTIIVSLAMKDEQYKQNLAQLLSERNSGIILLATELDWEDIKPFQQLTVPLVVVDAWYREGCFDTVLMENSDAMYCSASHLIEKGYKKIGYLDSKIQIRNFYYRKRGFSAGMQEHGLAIDEKYSVCLSPTMSGAYEDMKQYLDTQPELPEAYCAVNDIIAIGAMRALQEKGIRIPDDIGLIGFDNMPFGEFTAPPLTTIHVPKRELGTTAAQLLLSKSSGASRGPVKIELLTSLIERGTTRQMD